LRKKKTKKKRNLGNRINLKESRVKEIRG